MGWVAYKFIRSTGGAINVIFPQTVSRYEDTALTRVTMSGILEAYPDFPVEATVFAPTRAVDAMKEFGFGNTVDSFSFAGETWTLANGNRVVFGPVELSSSGAVYNQYIRFFPPDSDSQYTNLLVRDFLNNSYFTVSFGPWKAGENYYTQGTFSYYPGNKTVSFGSLPYPHTLTRNFPFFDGVEPVTPESPGGDPYDKGGNAESGGGTGSFDGTGDDISVPSLPTLSATDVGFITLFNPTLGEMNSLASYMWSDLFDIDGWKKIFADPMQAILGLSIVPVAVPNGGSKAVKVGNISTGVNMTVAASQYVEVDCGTLNVNEYWGAYLDYDPYTKAEIYLPYIGIHPISTDDIMNKPVHVVYHVDILSGACCAYVQCGGSVLYSFIGQCASSIPITGDNWTNVVNGAISIAGAIGSMVATGGASAPMAIGQIASTAVNTMKPSVEKSGAMGGTGGMLGVQTPYLILTRPRQALPQNQNAFIGYPSFITERLGGLSGYTEIDSIHLESVPATEPELSEIESLLKSGVIF